MSVSVLQTVLKTGQAVAAHRIQQPHTILQLVRETLPRLPEHRRRGIGHDKPRARKQRQRPLNQRPRARARVEPHRRLAGNRTDQIERLSRTHAVEIGGLKEKSADLAESPPTASQSGSASAKRWSTASHHWRARLPVTASLRVAWPWARLKTAAQPNRRRRRLWSSARCGVPRRRCSPTHRL